MYKSMHAKNLFIFIFILWYSTEIVFNTTIQSIWGFPVEVISNVVSWIIFILLMIQILLFQSYKRRELLTIMVFAIPIIVATMTSGKRSLLSALMFIVAAKNYDFSKIIRVAYKIILVMLPIIFFLCIFGFIDDHTTMRGNIVRYSLGLSHPNQLGLRIFQLTVCHCYVNRYKLGVWNYIYIFLAILFTIAIPNAQTAYISLIVLLLLLLVYRYIDRYQPLLMKLYTRVILVVALLLNVFSIFFSYIDVNRNSFLSWLNRWMSFRFSLCHRVWMLFGVSFWGQRVYISEEERKLVGITNRLWLDNAYVSILLRYGILVFLITSCAYLCLLKNLAVRKEYVLFIILFLYSLYGIMENGLYMLTHNIFLLAFSDLLYHKMDENDAQYEMGQFAESAKVNE